MKLLSAVWLILASLFLVPLHAAAERSVELPAGVEAVWDYQKAFRETTRTSERVCLNGLWRWQPAGDVTASAVPESSWGWFKVPGPWPGITDYMQKDSQTLYPHLDWKDARLNSITAAWQQREIFIPENWRNRRIVVQTEYLNSFAAVYVDGKKAGEMRFPAGEVDITALCPPGQKHMLTMLVVAMPLKAVLQSYTDSAAARTVKGSVPRRGTCGDVFLVATTRGRRITDVRVETSHVKGEVRFYFNITNSTAQAAACQGARERSG